MVGHTLSHYKIIEKLGEGGMGTVYKAEDLRLNRKVAVKIFSSIVTASPDDRTRFFQEARLASALNHPNIVTIHEFDESDGTAFIVSECVEGKTLSSLIQTGPLPIQQVLNIAVQIASGIAEAHSHDIIHRDIKPDNVMISFQGQAKVMDFGLARMMGSSHLTNPGSLIGTFAYMSPEQINEEEVDAQSDIFSFGTLLYQLIANDLPFKGKTVAELLTSITRKHPDSLQKYRDDVSEELDRIVFKALQKDKQRRYLSMNDVRADLERLRDNPSMKRRFNTHMQMRKHIILIGILVLSLVIAGYFVFQRMHVNQEVPRKQSIAVLPFTNENSEETIGFLSLGLADDIITRLSFIRNLMVKPTIAIADYQGKNVNISKAGEELGVDYVVYGRFHKVDDQFYVSVQIINVQSGSILWADKIAFQWKDIQSVQDNVANRLLEALQLELTKTEFSEVHRIRTGNAEAYEYYLRGVVFTVRDSRSNNEMAMKMFERAIALDGHFAEAFAAISRVYTERFWSNYSPDTVWISKGEAMAREALRLDSKLADGHSALGFALRVRGKYPESIMEVVQALSLDRYTSFSIEDLTEFYRNRGDFDKAVALAEKAAEIDPSFNINRVRARLHMFQGKYAESVVELERAIRFSPADSWLRGSLLANCYIHLGELDKAEKEIQIAETMDYDKPETRVTRAMLYTVRGDYQQAQMELDKIQRYIEHDYAIAYYAAAIYSKQKRIPEAIAAMRNAKKIGNYWYASYSDSWFANVRDNTEFQEILRSMKTELDSLAVELMKYGY
ncbi:MAG: protein kinase [Ignavibacteria bacterium]|nr:protein kinase [Ignavibacteria bacterium]